MKKICIFTQTYSNDRKLLFDYHNLDIQDIIFRNNFDNIYAFHNCSKNYINGVKNYEYFKSINNIQYIEYYNIVYTESFKKTLFFLLNEGYEYVIFIQDDCFTDLYYNFDNLIKFINNEDFLMLNIENGLDIDKEIFYQDDDFTVYNTDSLDFSCTINPLTNKKYWCFDDGPYVANLKYIIDNIYDDTYYSIGNIQSAEKYLMKKINEKSIQRLTINLSKYSYIYRRRNIIGPESQHLGFLELSSLKDRFNIKCEKLM